MRLHFLGEPLGRIGLGRIHGADLGDGVPRGSSSILRRRIAFEARRNPLGATSDAETPPCEFAASDRSRTDGLRLARPGIEEGCAHRQ